MIIYIYVGVSLLVGGLVGYFVFYLTYKEVKTIQGIKEKLAKSLKEIEELKINNEKLKDENKILRDEGKELLEKYDDMSRVIAELSRYSTIIKEGGEIAKVLAVKLGVFDVEIHDRVQRVLKEKGLANDDVNNHNNESPIIGKTKKLF